MVLNFSVFFKKCSSIRGGKTYRKGSFNEKISVVVKVAQDVSVSKCRGSPNRGEMGPSKKRRFKKTYRVLH